jgi:hypothetical protein
MRAGAGLSASRDPRAVAWRAAVKGKTIPRQAFIDNYPIRNQSGPMSNHEFADPVNKLVWTYSQDAAAFIGRAQFTGVRKAALPVDSLPILGVRLPMTGEALFPHHIAAYDAAALAWRLPASTSSPASALSSWRASRQCAKYSVSACQARARTWLVSTWRKWQMAP